MKKIDQLNNLPQEQELLTILMEECAEVTQAASKIIRFGESEQNSSILSSEVGDLLAVIDLCFRHGLLQEEIIASGMKNKVKKLKFYSNIDVS